MNPHNDHRDIIAPMDRQHWLGMVLAAATLTVSLSAQTPTKKTTPQTRPDTWERSKECAAQSEKFVTESDRRRAETGAGGPALHWENHYSTKYNRCFVLVSYTIDSQLLFDAFERTNLAFATIKETDVCAIEEKHAKCADVWDFMNEHMRN